MYVLYHSHEDPFYMEPTKIKLPTKEYVINEQLRAWCEEVQNKE